MAGSRRARTGRGWDAAPPRMRPDDGPRHRARGRGPDDGGSQDTRADVGQGRPGALAGQTPPADRAREICLRLLAVRPRTRQELATALRQRGISDDVAADILERYSEVGMVDDRAFARAWVTSRHHGKGLAGRALAGELRRKGVQPDAIGEALDELGQDTEARTARELVERKLRGGRGGSPEATMRRLVGMLARKGYPPALAFRVVRDAMATEDLAGELSDAAGAEDLEAALEAAELDANIEES